MGGKEVKKVAVLLYTLSILAVLLTALLLVVLLVY